MGHLETAGILGTSVATIWGIVATLLAALLAYLLLAGRARYNQGLHAGAVEDPSEALARIDDVDARLSYEARLHELATRDPLTALLNRRGFMDELRRHAADRGRSGEPVALLIVDIDNFKDTNAIFGRDAGDELLAKLAHLLSVRLRETDTVARIGGDEFAIVLPRADEAAAVAVAEEIVARVHEVDAAAAAERPSGLTVSVGVAMLGEEQHVNVEAVLVNADLAMYEAKQSGRDRVVRFTGDDGVLKLAQARLNWRDRLTHAVEEGGFELFAQPIVAFREPASHLNPTRFELLLRMRDDEGGLIGPDGFMEISERLGMMRSIDRWVVEQAITTLAEHQRPERALTLHVNVSGSSIGDEPLLDLIEQRLGETGIEPSSLVVEVTETAAIPEMLSGRAWTERLAALGCRLALDDFGAGFGSFHYLKHLRFDFLKIDGAFVRQAETSATDRLLISAAVGIARGLGCETIAEWVGDAETVALLQRLGVDSGQGFHLGRPLPLDQALSSTPAPG